MELEQLIINLIISINNNNFEQTKLYVDLINNYTGEISITTVTDMLDIHRIDNYDLNNECFDYVLINLHYLNRPEDVRWYRQRNRLLNNQNKIETENFILNQLNNKTYNIDNKIFIQTLIQLAVTLKDRNKIAEILLLISNSKFMEE